MNPIRLCRFEGPDGKAHMGLTDDWASGVVDLTPETGATTIPEWVATLPAGQGAVLTAAHDLLLRESRTPLDPERLLLPIDCAELWAAGVTYEKSRDAREQETTTSGTIYDLVYEAPRPELFFKAPAGRMAGPGEAVGLRRDAVWHVPEPELTVILGPDGAVFGYTVGNDMTARDIEARNPLYLPQAKVFHHSAALGPAVVLAETVDLGSLTIRLRVSRRGMVVFSGEAEVARLHRSVPELLQYLGQEWPLSPWTGLMTGTGMVPPDYFALEDGDEIAVAVDEIGTLINVARRIDESWVPVAPALPRLLRIDPRDNVAVALGMLAPGYRTAFDDGTVLTLEEAVPFGHKAAVVPIAQGEPIIKYGAVIGLARTAIRPGQYVHTHNTEGTRGRGDLGRNPIKPGEESDR